LKIFKELAKNHVISTEAAHSFIVRCAVERALYFAFAVVVDWVVLPAGAVSGQPLRCRF
jgi:hypothetical protein